VPFDNIGVLITGSKSKILQMLSVLKLVRVMRLSRMISRLNAKDHIKISLRLGLMVFYTILYLHTVACFWYFVAKFDKEWIPNSSYAWQIQLIYSKDNWTIYLQVLYAACLTTTGNDITPLSTKETVLVTSLLVIGMLVNAIIFGNMVISIQELNIKFSKTQDDVDLMNTAMKNIRLSRVLQSKVMGYFKYTY